MVTPIVNQFILIVLLNKRSFLGTEIYSLFLAVFGDILGVA